MLHFQESRTRLTAKSFKARCTPPLLTLPREVVVDLAAAELRLRSATPPGRSLRMPEIDSQAKGGPSRFKLRHGWQRKILQLASHQKRNTVYLGFFLHLPPGLVFVQPPPASPALYASLLFALVRLAMFPCPLRCKWKPSQEDLLVTIVWIRSNLG